LTGLEGTNSAKNMTWDAPSNGLPAAVNSWNQGAAYTGTVTFLTRYGGVFDNLVVTGDTLLAGGSWTHPANAGTEQYRLRVTVGGNLTVGPSGKIDVSRRGYAPFRGPGNPNSVFGHFSQGSGVAHGGEGHANLYTNKPDFFEVNYLTYGAIRAPTALGSGNGMNPNWGTRYGGGALWLTVRGTLTVNGSLLADGDGAGNNGGGSSGGSIWVEAGSMRGTGTLRARGGADATHGGGSGGRIALYLTQSGSWFGEFAGTVTAYGNSGNGMYSGAGTVYRERVVEDRGYGEVRVANNTASTLGTALPPYYGTGEDLSRTRWTVQDYGRVNMLSNVAVYAMNLAGANARLNLRSNTLTTAILTITNRSYAVGTYTTNNLGSALVGGSGSIVVSGEIGRGGLMIVR
jgi:hypothetical protein